jgi:PBSX family phage terminase large subunit
VSADVITKRLKLRGAAKEVMHAREGEVLIAGAAGTGKSFAVLYKLHLMCMKNGACPKGCQVEHEHRERGMRALIVRKTHNSLTSTGLVTFKQHVATEALELGLLKWYGGSGSEPPQFIYGNGSQIMVGGMDNPTKIMSSEYDVIFAQEATELSITDWEKLTSRLRNGRVSFQQLIADCNPEGPDHWLKLRCDEGKTRMLYALHTDNPMLFDDAGTPTERGQSYLAVLDNLTGVRKLRLQGGIWAAAEGVIYERWSPSVHLTDRKVLPKEWRRIWGIDFGYVNPFVWQMWAIDPDGRMWLEKEIYQTQMLVEDIWHKKILPVLTMQDGVTWKYPKPDWIITDHDAEDRATFERHSGLRTTAAFKEVSPGIQAMQKRMVVRDDGKPRLLVCRDSLVERDPRLKEASLPIGFAGEVTGYVWKPKPSSTANATDKPTPDEPLKVNDHAMDTARYVCAQLDLRGVPRVRHL